MIASLIITNNCCTWEKEGVKLLELRTFTLIIIVELRDVMLSKGMPPSLATTLN
jgi:hypothetical protein